MQIYVCNAVLYVVRVFFHRMIVDQQAVFTRTFYDIDIRKCIFIYKPVVYVYLILSTLVNIGQTGFMMLIWAFVTDCIDYQEWKTNKRADGTLYSIYTFSKKIGTSLTHSGSTYLLAAIAGVVEIIGMGLK